MLSKNLLIVVNLFHHIISLLPTSDAAPPMVIWLMLIFIYRTIFQICTWPSTYFLPVSFFILLKFGCMVLGVRINKKLFF